MENETHEQRLSRIAREIDAQQRREEAAWYPSSVIERTALNVLGCWSMVVAEVNAVYFHAAGPGAPPLNKEKLPAKIRKAADLLRIRWPHDDWSAAADRPSKVRHKLAHLLYVDSVTGRRPNRTMTIVRMGAPGEPRNKSDEHPTGLSWREVPDPVTDPDGVAWSQMTMHRDVIEERDLSEALDAMRWARDCCMALNRLGSIAADIKPRRDLVLPDHEQEYLPWWLPEWGDRETTRLKWGDVMTRP